METLLKIILWAEIVICFTVIFSFIFKLKNTRKKCYKCNHENAMKTYNKSVVGYYTTNKESSKNSSRIKNIIEEFRRCKYCGHEDTRVDFKKFL